MTKTAYWCCWVTNCKIFFLLGGFMIVCKLGFSILVMVVGGQFHNKGFVSFANIGYSEHAAEIRRRC